MEHTVVNCYKHGKLDKPLLKILLEPYRDTDIDSGGKQGLLVCEGGVKLEVEDIVIKVMTGKYIPPPKLPRYAAWTETHCKLNDNYLDKRRHEFNKITRKFGW